MEKLEIEAGKNYKISTPNHFRKTKVHIDYILKNPINKHKYASLIVYRIWVKHKGWFNYYCECYYTLAIFNDWKYMPTEQKNK